MNSELRIGRCRETDFDLLEAKTAEELEHIQLFFQGHRFDQSLIAVPEVNTAPSWRLGDMVLLYPVGAFLRRREVSDAVLCVILFFSSLPFFLLTLQMSDR